MKLSPSDALKQLRNAKTPFIELFQHGSLAVEIYKPVGQDLQQPHTRDEIYVILSGHGIFYSGGERFDFGAGDFFFVPAGTVHRFESFSDDFVTWVFFFGPEGGETGFQDQRID